MQNAFGDNSGRSEPGSRYDEGLSVSVTRRRRLNFRGPLGVGAPNRGASDGGPAGGRGVLVA